MSTLEPPSNGPRRGLSKLRRSRKEKDSDKSSSTTSVNVIQEDSNLGFRASIDGALGKLKDRRRKSSDDRRGSADSNISANTTSRLSKLPLQLPGKSRRKKSSTKNALFPSPPTDDRSNRGVSPSPSELSLGLEGSGHSSLMTEDSDYEE